MLFTGIALFKERAKEANSRIYEGPLGTVLRTELESIYHHLQPGSKVDLSIVMHENKAVVAVHFKGFLIGYLPESHTPLVLELLSRGFFLCGEVKCVYKRKYMPAEQVEISITDQFTQA